DSNDNFSHYLSFRFYKENLDHLKDRTKDSINNFLKTISEIEDEFVSILQHQQPELPMYELEVPVSYMEENY
ncbi:MAG TPA: hypothetical protein VGI82_08175, partial [Chitinophagaceae bacterium]